MEDKGFVRVALVAVGLLLSAMAGAEIFQWTDENGQVHFTDEPPPNKGTKVELEITQPSRVPDEGEVRRLKLLNSARRRAEHDAAVEETREKVAAVGAVDTPECLPARHRWYALTQEMPVYWAADGTIRGQWQGDFYTGARDYINDTQRTALMNHTAQEITVSCANGNTDEDDGSGYQEWLRADDCEADKRKLQFAKQPRSRSTKQKLRDLEASVRRNCD